MTVTKIFSPSWPKILRFQSGFQAWRKKVLQHWNLISWVKAMCLNILLKVQNWMQTSHTSHTSFPKSNAWRMVPFSQLKCPKFFSAWYLFLKISMPSLMKEQWNGQSQEAPQAMRCRVLSEQPRTHHGKPIWSWHQKGQNRMYHETMYLQVYIKKNSKMCSDGSHLVFVFVFATQSNFVFATQSKYAFIHELFLLEVFPFLCLCYFKQQRITFRRTLHILLDEICKWEYDSFGRFSQTRELHFSDENCNSPTRITFRKIH